MYINLTPSRDSIRKDPAKMKTLFLVAALIALGSAVPRKTGMQFRNLYVEPTGKPHPHPRIIGGREATPHSIPWQAFLEVYSGNSGWYCGGSLISKSYVLTAAHCVVDATEADVILGAHKPQTNENTQVRVTSRDTTAHRGYDDQTFNNDIGIIALPQAVGLTDAIDTVPLPTSASNDYTGSAARISGWGLTDGHGNTISDVLNVLDTTIISNSECASQLGDIVKSNNVCTTGAKSTGTCSGDSGGPLTVNGVQVGVVSFGIQYCPPGYPSAYTRVTEYLDWISQNSDV